MLWLPQKGQVKVITNCGIVGTATPGTGVPNNATTLLNGAVTELISAASNTQDSWLLELFISATGAATTASEACLDILIGGATDDVLVAALICGYSPPSTPGHHYFFPVHIPQGKRIAAIHAGVRTNITAQVCIWLYGGTVAPAFRVGRKIATLGTQINNARGQAITPTASGGAASVTQLIASTTEDYFAFMPGFQAATDTSITPIGYFNIGIGVGADPPDRVGTWWYSKNLNEEFGGPWPQMPGFRDVPAGSRITLLASNTGANDTAYDALVYAVA